jgi:hypothetical protein
MGMIHIHLRAEQMGQMEGEGAGLPTGPWAGHGR